MQLSTPSSSPYSDSLRLSVHSEEQVEEKCQEHSTVEVHPNYGQFQFIPFLSIDQLKCNRVCLPNNQFVVFCNDQRSPTNSTATTAFCGPAKHELAEFLFGRARILQ